MPCTDIHDMNTSAGSELANISTDNHSTCPHEQDFCSPFCVCSCCGQLFVLTQLPNFSPALPIIHNYKEKTCFLFSENWQSNYLKSIFRPPQV
jgi:hypothetical protein